jgi:hypothetical protein
MYNTKGIGLKSLVISREQGLNNYRDKCRNINSSVVTERSLTPMAGSGIETSNEKEDNCSVPALIRLQCDATETSPCSECSSRSHKCQFTKETNRRMSSIK